MRMLGYNIGYTAATTNCQGPQLCCTLGSHGRRESPLRNTLSPLGRALRKLSRRQRCLGRLQNTVKHFPHNISHIVLENMV